MTDQNWQIRSSRTLLADRWINVRADSCVTASGTTIEPYYVLTYPDWVNVVALTKDDRLILIRQYRHAAARVFLELPGGIVDSSDENPEDTAQRELAEETGYQSSNMRRVATLYTNPSMLTNRVHTCLTTDVLPGNGQTLDEGEEGLTVELVPVRTILQGLGKSVVEQSMHVSSIVLALAQVGRISL
jgi:8-oxo-dGTP pyrophosphatase MutT (NUDIX family)